MKKMTFGENLIHMPITIEYCQNSDYYLFTLACCYFCSRSNGQSSGSYGHWTAELTSSIPNKAEICEKYQVNRRSLSKYYPGTYILNEDYVVWQISDLKEFLEWLLTFNCSTQKRCSIFRVYAFFRYKTTYFGGTYQRAMTGIQEELGIGCRTLLSAIEDLVEGGWLSRYGTPSVMHEQAYRYRILK